MHKLLNAVTDLAAVSYLVSDSNEEMSIDKMFETYRTLPDKLGINKWNKALKNATTYSTPVGPIEVFADSKQLQ